MTGAAEIETSPYHDLPTQLLRGNHARKKCLEQQTEVPVSMRTATRAGSSILVAGAAEIETSPYHDLPSYFEGLEVAR